VPGALNVQLASPEFEQRVGWVAPPDVPLVLVHDDDEEAAVAVRALAFVGLDSRVAGHLAGGVAAWVASGRALDTLEQLDVHVLHARLSGPRAPRVVDVREPSEWRAGHIAGAQQLSYRVLAGRAHELGAAADEPIAVVCHGGGRSSTACSLLRRAGFSNVVNVSGGMQAWQATGLPIETGMGCAADVDPPVGPSR
jgi:hydroxyacylglutathione hydrolase